MTDGDALLRAIIAQPDEDTPRLAYADWLDEQGQSLAAALQRVLAVPGDDALRLAYADVCDTLGGDYELRAEVVRAMVRYPDLFEPAPHVVSFNRTVGHPGGRLVSDVTRNLDLIAWAELDLQTYCANGDYVWVRETAAGEHDRVHLTWRRGFVDSVGATLGGFLATAARLFRHPVREVRLRGVHPWQDASGEWWGWWDINRIVAEMGGAIGGADASELPTELMVAMADDPRRCDGSWSLRFQPDRAGMGGCCLFASAADAAAALQRAVVRHGHRTTYSPVSAE